MPRRAAYLRASSPPGDLVRGGRRVRQRSALDAHGYRATFHSKTSLRNGIKRADRLLGNGKLRGETRTFYAALCRVLLARIAEPLILIDWSDLKADQSLHLLRASLAVGGRSLTLYEKVHGQKLLGNLGVQKRFLRTLARLLSARVAPSIIADSGFKVPFYREVGRLG
jgi:hypothetical protein